MLKISTKRKRESIQIDGKQYELLGWEDLPLEEFIRAASTLRLLSDGVEDLSGEQSAKALATIRRLSDLFLANVPEKIREKLSDMQRISIIGAVQAADDFFAQPTVSKTRSRVSAGSMVARRKTGSR